MLVASLVVSLPLLPGCANDTSSETSEARLEEQPVADVVSMRAELEKDLGQPVSVVVHSRRTEDDWLLLSARAVRPDGRPIDFGSTRYAVRVNEGMFDEEVIGLFHRENAGWRLRAWEIGAEGSRRAWLVAHGASADLASSDDEVMALGRPDRSQAMLAARSAIEYELGQSAVVIVSSLHAKAGWAYLVGRPVKPDGSSVDYRGTEYERRLESGSPERLEILLRNPDGEGWFVVETRLFRERAYTPAVDGFPAEIQPDEHRE